MVRTGPGAGQLRGDHRGLGDDPLRRQHRRGGVGPGPGQQVDQAGVGEQRSDPARARPQLGPTGRGVGQVDGCRQRPAVQDGGRDSRPAEAVQGVPVEVAVDRPGDVVDDARRGQQRGQRLGADCSGLGHVPWLPVVDQRRHVGIGVREREHVGTGGRGPQAVQPLLGQRAAASGDRAVTAGGDQVAVLVGHVGDGLDQVGVDRPGHRRTVTEPGTGLDQPVQPSADREVGGQRVVGEPAVGLPDRGVHQWPDPAEAGRADVGRLRHPRQQGPGDGDPTGGRAAGAHDLDAQHVDPELGQRRNVGQRLVQGEGRRASRCQVDQPRLDEDVAVPAGHLAGHHGGQLGPAVQVGGRESQPDGRVPDHLVAVVGHGAGHGERRPGRRDAREQRGHGDLHPAGRPGTRRRGTDREGDEQDGQRAEDPRATGARGPVHAVSASRSAAVSASRRSPAYASRSRSSSSGTQATSSTSRSWSLSSPPEASSR